MQVRGGVRYPKGSPEAKQTYISCARWRSFDLVSESHTVCLVRYFQASPKENNLESISSTFIESGNRDSIFRNATALLQLLSRIPFLGWG
jgi:hypothetical protein